MAEKAVQNISNDGLVVAWTACSAAGDTVLNDTPGKILIMFRDTGGSGGQVVTPTVENDTFDIPPYGDVTANGKPKTLAADGEVAYNDLSAEVFNDVDGFVEFTYSDHTNLEIAVIKVA